ncbi:hypothetical protein O0I10_011636 [Lichtheimia ornata]|uniref:F-box domain-containing protein n=1 Tax=Lichtheimia ornata TaxID=688661 RepID=A0AAD7UU41_9FUNG|nr:uncharacterized protein O0I10_011636 [Lichtheimia ornata]KAJ8652754.1 hypothetical protein O0I10_011636 [Lichtheimia ornata]
MANGSFAAIFPHEVTGYIFSLLSQKDRIQCIHVCHLWRQGVIYWCDQAWRTTQLRLFDIDSMIAWLADVSPIIHCLHIDSTLDPSFDAADIQEAVHGDTDIEDSMRNQQHIPAAKEIPTHLSKLLSIPFDQLKSIRYDTNGVNAEILQCLIQLAGSKVRTLNIQAIYQFMSKKPLCVAWILDQCPQLETFIDSESVCEFVVKDKTSLIPCRLENLDLARQRFDSKEIMFLLTKCPCLRRLRLSCWFTISMSPIIMLEKCPRLESLEWCHLRYGSPSFYRPEWWRRRQVTYALDDEQQLSSTPSTGLRQLVMDNVYDTDQYACINTIINRHHATLTRISITLYMDVMRSRESINPIPMNLERLDYHFHQGAQEEIESFIRPLVEHCHHLKSLSIRTDFRYADPNEVVLPRWFFVAMATLHALQHLAIEVDNDADDMVHFLEAAADCSIPLASLYYHGDWMTLPCIDAIGKINTLRSLALSTHEKTLDTFDVSILTGLQQLPHLESLAFKHHENGFFQSPEAFDCLYQFPCLKQLFISIQDGFNVDGIRHLADRQPPLEEIVLLDLTGDCSEELESYGLEEALDYAREKIANVQGGRVCPECDHHTRKYDM